MNLGIRLLNNFFIRRLNFYFRAILYLVIFSFSNNCFALDTLKLGIDDAILMALQNSPAMNSARMDSLTSDNQWRRARGLRLPQIRFSQDAPSWRESLDERFLYDSETGKDSLTRVKSGDLRWQSRIDVSQATPWGATVDVSSRIYQRRWYWTGLEGRVEDEEYSLLNRILVEQPIFAGNPVLRDHKMNKIDFKRGQIDFELQKREVIYNLKSIYYGQVLAEEALIISGRNLDRGLEAKDLADRKFNAGLIPEIDLMRIQVDLARRQGEYSQSEARAESAKERLRLLLGLSIDQPIEVRFQDEFDRIYNVHSGSVAGKRLEIEADELSLEKLDIQTEASIVNKRIKASIQLYYELDTRRENFSELSETGDQNRGVSLYFEIPIYGFGTTVTEIENLKIAKNKTFNEMKIRMSNMKADNRRAIRDLELARKRINIVSASLELSRKSLAISESRFKNGLINSRELIESQLELTRGNQELLNARIDYELSMAYLERIAPRNDY